MTLNVTVGGAYAESFCTVIEANTILNTASINTSNLTHWNSLSETAKEMRLRLSAQFLGTLPLRGKRVYAHQALCFPRSSQLVKTEIPVAVKQAQALLAYLLIDPNIALTDPNQSRTESIQLEQALVRSVEVVGIMKVGVQNTIDAATLKAQAGLESYLAKALKAYGGFVYLLLKPYLSQIRGGNIDALTIEEAELLTSPDYNL